MERRDRFKAEGQFVKRQLEVNPTGAKIVPPAPFASWTAAVTLRTFSLPIHGPASGLANAVIVAARP
ncbi:MAG: hypothetical protein R2932_48290 [Caldilineaceae bacterium]